MLEIRCAAREPFLILFVSRDRSALTRRVFWEKRSGSLAA
jgi:hypothetical protein